MNSAFARSLRAHPSLASAFLASPLVSRVSCAQASTAFVASAPAVFAAFASSAPTTSFVNMATSNPTVNSHSNGNSLPKGDAGSNGPQNGFLPSGVQGAALHNGSNPAEPILKNGAEMPIALCEWIHSNNVLNTNGCLFLNLVDDN